MNARAVARLIAEHLQQAESLGYDYAIKVALGGDGSVVLHIRDLDTDITESFAVYIEEENPGYCLRDRGCSLERNHEGDCYLTAAL